MPHAYEVMRDKFAKTMGYDAAQRKAARIYNSQHPNSPVGRFSHGKRKKRKKGSDLRKVAEGARK
jgi:hypothetical protein